MTGSHKVIGSIPIYSTLFCKGRRRLRPFFVFLLLAAARSFSCSTQSSSSPFLPFFYVLFCPFCLPIPHHRRRHRHPLLAGPNGRLLSSHHRQWPPFRLPPCRTAGLQTFPPQPHRHYRLHPYRRCRWQVEELFRQGQGARSTCRPCRDHRRQGQAAPPLQGVVAPSYFWCAFLLAGSLCRQASRLQGYCSGHPLLFLLSISPSRLPLPFPPSAPGCLSRLVHCATPSLTLSYLLSSL